MPVTVTIPLKIRLDAASLASCHCSLRSAVAAASSRALVKSRQEVLAPRTGYAGLRLNEPEFTWSGEQVIEAGPVKRKQIEGLVRDVLAAEVRRARLFEWASESARTLPLLAEEPWEEFDPRRGSDLLGLYTIPTYQGGGAKKAQKLGRAKPAAAHTETHTETVHTWKRMDSGWPAQASNSLLEAWEQSCFRARGMSVPSGYRGLIWLTKTGRLELYVRNPPSLAGQVLFTGNFLTYKRVISGTAVQEQIGFRAISYVPAANAGFAEWWPVSEIRALMKADVERDIASAPKPELVSEQEKQAAIPAAVEEEVDRRMKWAEKSADALAVDIGGSRTFFSFDASVARFAGRATLAPVTETQNVAVSEDAGSVPGAAGAGSEPGSEGQGGAGTGTGTGKGSAEGEGSLVFWGDDAAQRSGKFGYPNAGAGHERLTQCTEPFEGEPSLDRLPAAAASQIAVLIKDIAYRLNLQPCKYPAAFSIAASEAVGKLALTVSKVAVSPGSGKLLLPPKHVAAANGSIDFTPSAAPALQYLRVLASAVPRISELARLLEASYREHSDLISGFRHGDPIGWLLDYGYPLYSALRMGVARHFVAATQIVFMQLLYTSKLNLDARRSEANAENYAAYFERLVQAQLLPIQELEDLRSQLIQIVGSGSTMRDVGTSVLGAWRSTRGALFDALQGRNPFRNIGKGAYGTIVRGENGKFGIRDSKGKVWSVQDLDRAIAFRNDQITVDPLFHQLIADPEVRERFSRNPDGIREELAALLTEMVQKNADITASVRDDPSFAFSLAPLNQNFEQQTIPGVPYALSGVHKMAHEAVGEFFRGDVYYAIGVGAALGLEDFRKTLISVVEITTIVLASIACPALGVAVGAGWAVYHEVKAAEKHSVYLALIDPEEVLSFAEVEAEQFAADLGLILSIIPAGKLLAKVGAPAVAKVVQGEVRAAGAFVARQVTRRFLVSTLRALEEDLVKAFITHVVSFEVVGKVMEKMLSPVMEEIERSHMTLAQLDALAAEVHT